jgi:hypothetical protein
MSAFGGAPRQWETVHDPNRPLAVPKSRTAASPDSIVATLTELHRSTFDPRIYDSALARFPIRGFDANETRL